MKKLLLITLIISFNNSILNGQIWTKTYDGGFGYSFDKTSDGGYIISGSSLIKTDSQGDTLWTKGYSGLSVIESNDGGYVLTGGDNDGLTIVKTDINGDTLWTKVHDIIPDDLARDGLGVSIVETQDGGYIITGNTDYDTYNYSILLLKTDSVGDTLWTKFFLSSGGAQQVIESNDGGFVVVGWTQGKTFLLKTDSVGDTLWTKLYGEYRSGYSLDQTTDGGFIITGTYVNENDIETIQIIKTDSVGNLLWDKNYEDGRVGFSIEQTTDEGFILTGNNSEGSLIIIKTNSNGDHLWTKSYGDIDQGFGRTSILETSDGGYIISGTLNDPYKVILMKTDSEGNIQSCNNEFINYGTEVLIDCYFEEDLEFLQLLIDNSQSEDFPPPPDLSPLDLGFQNWENGRITELCISNGFQGNCSVDNYRLNIELPSEIGNLDSLYRLDLKGGLGGNQMIGDIPIEIWSLNSLSNLDLSGNQFSGVLPESICELDINWSEDFYLNDNYLCPPYPSCVQDYLGQQDTTECLPLSIITKTFPSEFLLRKPYPNPFNPSTTLDFSIPFSDNVNIRVLDISGKEVDILMNKYVTNGNHRIEWNSQGHPSGIYFISFESGRFVETQKVILTK
jgi:hypothetical protein